MSSAVIDLDGSISDNSHRENLIEGENKKWREYLQKASEDDANEEILNFVQKLAEEQRIVILTCRSDEVKKETINWLNEHEVPFDDLIMLPEGRWELSDSKFKRDKLEEIENPVIAIDDKKENCEMFRQEGLEVYTVKEGSPVKYAS